MEKQILGVPLIVYLISGITALVTTVLIYLSGTMFILTAVKDTKNTVIERTAVIQPLTVQEPVASATATIAPSVTPFVINRVSNIERVTPLLTK